MKYILLLFIPFYSFSQNSLLFSEYGEGSSNNKWIEIFNPTSQEVSLDDYRYNFCWNGCDSLQWEYSISFDSGFVLLPYETYLIVHHDADDVLLNASNQITNILSNGNDVIALLNFSTNEIIDIIGVFDSVSVDDGWDIGLNNNATMNQTLYRNPNVCSGNFGNWNISNGSILPAEWSINQMNDFTNINVHTSDCMNTHSVVNLFNSEKKLIFIKDVLGRNVKNSINTIQFYIYNDGTSEKRIVVE